jgi:hypothetical protein
LHARSLQPHVHLLKEALDQLVAQIVVRLTLGAQAIAVQREGPHRFHRARIELPSIRRIKPRPSQHLARLYCLNLDWTAAGDANLQRDAPAAHQVGRVGLLPSLNRNSPAA